MRVIVRLEERVDPPASRALWQLLFSVPPEASPVTPAPKPDELLGQTLNAETSR